MSWNPELAVKNGIKELEKQIKELKHLINPTDNNKLLLAELEAHLVELKLCL